MAGSRRVGGQQTLSTDSLRHATFRVALLALLGMVADLAANAGEVRRPVVGVVLDP